MDHAIEADRILHFIAEVPPLFLVVLEAMALQRRPEALPVLGKTASRICRVRSWREHVEWSSHRELVSARQMDQGHIHRNSEVVPAAGCDIAVAEEIGSVRPLRPRHHCLTSAHRAVRVQDLETVTIQVKVFVRQRERGRRFVAEVCVLPFVTG